MDERDRALRHRIYAQLRDLGRVPTIDETGADEAALRRLEAEHALVLEPDGSAFRMLAPFSGVPTPWPERRETRERTDARCMLAALPMSSAKPSTCR